MKPTFTVISIFKWLKNGDHPNDGDKNTEGSIVRYFRHPSIKGNSACPFCGDIMHAHGFIDSGESGWVVCPGDYIVQTSAEYFSKEEYFPVKGLEYVMAGDTVSNSNISYLTRIGKVKTTLSLTPIDSELTTESRGENDILQ